MRIFIFLCSFCATNVLAQSDYKSFINWKGELEPVLTDNAVRDLYQQKLDITTATKTYETKDGASGTYLTKSSATTNVCYTAGNRTFGGFTGFGSGGTQVKMIVISSATGAVEGDIVGRAHTITGSKIMGINAIVHIDTNDGVTPCYTSTAEREFQVQYDATNVYVALATTNSGSILSKLFDVMIWYRE